MAVPLCFPSVLVGESPLDTCVASIDCARQPANPRILGLKMLLLDQDVTEVLFVLLPA